MIEGAPTADRGHPFAHLGEDKIPTIPTTTTHARVFCSGSEACEVAKSGLRGADPHSVFGHERCSSLCWRREGQPPSCSLLALIAAWRNAPFPTPQPLSALA